MILKNKRKIILILTVILFINTTFLPPKKTQAFDFVITPTVLWALGSLVTASGIIALNHEQVVDMGQYVWDRLEYKEGNMVYDVVDGVKNLIGVKADKNTIDAVSSVAEKIKDGTISNKNSRSATKYTETTYPSVDLTNGYFTVKSNGKVWDGNIDFPGLTSTNAKYSYLFENYCTTTFEFKGIPSSWTSDSQTSVIDYYYYNYKNSNIKFPRIDQWGKKVGFGLISVGGVLSIFAVTYRPNSSYGTTIVAPVSQVGFDLKINSNLIDYIVSSEDVGVIDYSSSHTGYVEGLVSTEMPYSDEIPGVITIPQSIPADLPLTTEFPLTWERAKEIVIPGVIPKDTDIPQTGEIEIPQTGEIDIPGVGEIEIPKFDTDGTTAIDLSPLYIDLKGKFPFCVPFDLINMITMFKSNRVTPHFSVKFDEGLVGGGEFEIDFSKFDKLASILRFFILLYFTFFLIKTSKSFATNG